MDRKGTGYEHEILFAVFFVILVLAFYAKGDAAIVPPILLFIGGIMLVGGMAIREPSVMAGGVAMLAIALIYYEVVV